MLLLFLLKMLLYAIPSSKNQLPSINATAPAAPLRILMITIGSRGDVQPFIALCKGFIAKGHNCTIGTHFEYKEWIEGFDGISYRVI
jgi:hypothetical protein